MNRTHAKILTFAAFGCALLFSSGDSFAHKVKEDNSWWWSDSWWKNGRLPVPVNHRVKTHWVTYHNGDVEIRALVARPRGRGRYPAVLFQHGRRGLDTLIRLHVRRLAARGFVVFAPDIYTGRFIGTHPIKHDYALEEDVNLGLTKLLTLPYISTRRACLYSHTRGGYYTLKVAVTKKRQKRHAACYVSYYPHVQDPNAPEPMQVYRYAPEVDDLKIPVLIFVGEKEQYQRMRSIRMAVESLTEKKRDARLIVYPGVGRGFDFRPEAVRTFADDLASKDALLRAARFMRKHLRRYRR